MFLLLLMYDLGQDDHLVVLPQWGIREALIFLDFFRPKG